MIKASRLEILSILLVGALALFALVHAATAIDSLDLTGDELVGARSVRKAIDSPLSLIASNAGFEGPVVVGRVRELGAGQGFNAQTGEFGDQIRKCSAVIPQRPPVEPVHERAQPCSLRVGAEVLCVHRQCQRCARVADLAHQAGHRFAESCHHRGVGTTQPVGAVPLAALT